MTFGGLLSIARTGLMTSQAQIATTSQNVTNAQTPGYSRQRARVSASYPQLLPQGNFGTGVQIDGVERMRNEMLDAGFRRDAGNTMYSEERRDALLAVEGILGEPSETGLSSSIEQLWSAWSDLSTNPDSSAARSVVRQRGAQVAAQLNQFGNQVSTASTVARTRLAETADRVNALAAQVAEINKAIVAAEASGKQAPDMRDSRDQKIDELASLVGATSYLQPNGSVNVMIGGDSLVDGANFKTVRVQALTTDTTKLGLALGPAPAGGQLSETMYQVGGQIAGLLDGYNTTYPAAMASLDGIASALVTSTNTVHRTGFVGATAAGDFYDASRTTARTIRLDGTIIANVNNIAASAIANESGDNGVALAMSQLRSTRVTVNGQVATIGEGYRSVVSNLAASANAASGTAQAARTLQAQTDAHRESIKGVSIDEEMVNLMKFQQSYAAAARLISVVDELSQTLINLGR
ncbi:MAG TPA: flagellar hook-associated protein FlgK [Gemmatimonadaceae bacterium]|nr:flagellar hook-associated protein FlgK [Gemmatimonadaceae bacterium]